MKENYNGVLDTYLRETEARKNPYKKAARRTGKKEELWVGTNPQIITPQPSYEAEKK